MSNETLANKLGLSDERRQRLDRISKLRLEHLETEDESRRADYHALISSGRVKPQFFRYSLEDMEELDNPRTLSYLLHDWLPNLERNNWIESVIVSLLVNYVGDRLYGKGCHQL